MSDETDISICNYTLGLLGIPRIESFNEGTDAAEICAAIYPKKRNAILAEFNWGINIRKRKLNRLADEKPLNEWTNVHSMPANMLSGPSAVFGDGSDAPDEGFEIYDGKIYSNYDSIIIDYFACPDESAFPPLLVDFLGHAVGAAAAMPLTQSADIADYLKREAYGPPQLDGKGGLYAKARRAVAMSKPTKSLFQNGDPLTGSRF